MTSILTMISPSDGTMERVDIGSLACQHVPSCLSNQLLVHDPSGGLSRHTSRDATPTPQIPAEIHVTFSDTCRCSYYILRYLRLKTDTGYPQDTLSLNQK